MESKIARQHVKELENFGKMVEKAIKYPDLTPDNLIIISLTEEEHKSILTSERIKLLLTIKHKKPKTVGELAEMIHRRKDAVSRDLSILKNYGFLELIQQGKNKKPVVKKEAIMIPLK